MKFFIIISCVIIVVFSQLKLIKASNDLMPVEFETTLCSACGVVSQEILLALEREVEANRKGASEILEKGITNIEIKMSEWQMIDMLDGVCDHMKVLTK